MTSTGPTSASFRAAVDIGAASHAGKVRPINEDHYIVVRFGRALDVLQTNLPPPDVPPPHNEVGYGMFVADGMGGAASGEVASATALRALVEQIVSAPYWILRWGSEEARQVLRRMEERIRKAREELAERARQDPALRGMGTTMTIALSLGPDLLLVHVGDSRAYLFRQGGLHQLTHDDTVIQELLDTGALSPEEARRHPLRHVLTDVVGTKSERLDLEAQHVALEDGDTLLLCTDGLSDLVRAPDIVSILQANPSAAAACDALIGKALEAGGKDNVTAVVARYSLNLGRPEASA